MKIKIVRIILLLLILGTCITIFNFSSEDSEKSGSTSQKITEVVTKRIEPIQKLRKYEKKIVLERIETMIRKLAHFLIYTLLGILIIALFSTYDISENKKIAITLLLGSFYALTDEFHQRFIPGRSAQISDVVLDSMGVFFGSLVVLLILKIIKKRKK